MQSFNIGYSCMHTQLVVSSQDSKATTNTQRNQHTQSWGPDARPGASTCVRTDSEHQLVPFNTKHSRVGQQISALIHQITKLVVSQ